MWTQPCLVRFVTGTDKIDYDELSDSDYELDPASDPAGYECDAINDNVTHDSDAEVLNNNTYSSVM